MSSVNVLINGKQSLTLTQNDYKAQGGQGTVYVKGGKAYKVYHDPNNMIPEAKIIELKGITSATILAPTDILYDPKKQIPIGFAMKYVDNTEYLTKMFSRNFKDTNGIDAKMIIKLVTEMQHALEDIHKAGVLVGDYNEMNFLVDASTYSIPYHIDVDSYQTKSFPCTAIMDTVRDRRLPFGKFDELSDWFSWAVVTFQMYTGTHPYMGRHPNFKTTELDQRMIQRVSVFDKDVKLPKACHDFSAIPQNQLEWYKKVFNDGYRSAPPVASSAMFVPGFTPIVVVGSDGFIVELITDYGDRILDVVYIAGVRYVITTKHIFKKDSEVFDFTKTPTNVKLLNLLGYDPVISVLQSGVMKFFTFGREEIDTTNIDGYMTYNNVMYTIHNGSLIEHMFTKGQRVMHSTKIIDTITPVFKAFEGVVVQDVFGKRRLSIPYASGLCASIVVPELEGHRIIDGKRTGQFVALITEKSGVYIRTMLHFDAKFSAYTIKMESGTSDTSINMVTHKNGMLVSIVNGDTVELMVDLVRGEKRITDCPADIDNKLIDAIDRIMFISDTKLYSLKMK